MTFGRHAPGIPGRGSRWYVDVLSKDGTELIAHHTADDEKECQAIATEARSKNLSHQILVKNPWGGSYKWA